MAQGVSGFIYNHQLKSTFDLYEDEIMSYLNCYCNDLNNTTAIGYVTLFKDYENSQGLINDLVWMYVEVKAHEILTNIKHPSVY